MTQETKNELVAFTERVFQYYNGRINPNIPARLEIKTIRDRNDIRSAYTMYPNIVFVQPFVSYEWCERMYPGLNFENRVFYTIIESVIHELFHVEQFLMYSRLDDVEYVRRIEADTDFMMASYILNHQQEIYQVFDVIVDEEIQYLHLFQPYRNRLYERKNIFEHICLFVDDTAGKATTRDKINEIIRKIIYYVEEVPDSILKYIINGHTIIIKDGDYTIDINQYNKEAYDHYYQFNYFNKVEVMEASSNKEYQYIVNTVGNYNVMARKIQP